MKTRPLRGSIRVPGDKSVSHRALIFNAMAEGDAKVEGLGTGHDVASTAVCLRRLGAGIELSEDQTSARVTGVGRRGFQEPEQVLDCGNSGTAMRLLAGVSAGVRGLVVLSGDASLSRRPMGRIADPLRAMGAVVDGRAGGSLPPLIIRGGALQGIDHHLTVASAQVKTALIIAGMQAEGTTRIKEPSPSRDHTERMLAAAGVALQEDNGYVSVEGSQRPASLSLNVPGDISSAFFLLAAASLVPRSRLEVTEVGLNPGRTGGLELLARMGASINWEEAGSSAGEPFGSVTVEPAELRGIDIPEASIPGAIDELPMIAVVASQAAGTTTFRGAQELRVKESDRIKATVEGLRAVGGVAEATPDGMVVEGPSRLTGGVVDSFGDHRVAMAFAVAGLIATSDIRILGWRSVDTSFPEFLDLMGQARGRR